MGSSEQLCRDDLKSRREVVFVECIGLAALSVVQDAMRFKRLTVFMHAIHGVKKLAWFSRAVQQGSLREFTFHPFLEFDEFWRAHDKAFDAVEAVYRVVKERGDVPVAPLVDLFRSGEVETAFKKQLLRRLTEFYEVLASVRLLCMNQIPVKLYVSAKWCEVGGWLREAGIGWDLPNDVQIMRSLRARLIQVETGLGHLKWAGVMTLLPAWVLLGVRRVSWAVPLPCSTQVGIRVYTSDWGFSGQGSREIDWLVDGRKIRRENTLFIIEKPISHQYRDEFERRDYRYIDISGRKGFRQVSLRFLLHELFGRGLKAWLRLSRGMIRTPGVFLEVAVRGWLEYLRWKALLDQWHPRHYVAYNHYPIEHFFRNASLRSAGCSSWYYVHSINDRCAHFYTSDRRIRCEEAWAYLDYDHELHWSKRDEALYREMHGQSRVYHTWGPLWSAHVRAVPHIAALVAQRRMIQDADATVALFDTSFGSGSSYGDSGAREFYDNLASMLDQPAWSRRLLLFKSKNDFNEFCAQASAKTVASLARLRRHSRCLVLPADIEPGAVIAEADLTVSIAYTSATIEALGARRRAIFFDPGGKFSDSYYGRFPNLVAHSPETLERLCDYWLTLPDANFQKYLDDHIATEFNGYLDSGAVARFREALTVE